MCPSLNLPFGMCRLTSDSGISLHQMRTEEYHVLLLLLLLVFIHAAASNCVVSCVLISVSCPVVICCGG